MTRGAYYNENDPRAAAWLRELIAQGHIAPGTVDERSITEVRATDLVGYVQCHFFAGIGVWSAALRGAGWRDDRPVWTGSCPCQPFSDAGRGDGFSDERHLWPEFYRLIAECNPPVVFGEQVASKDGLHWLDLVHADLEASSYAIGAVDLSAAGVGAPHIRQRLYWVADAGARRCDGRPASAGLRSWASTGNADCGIALGVADGCGDGAGQHARELRRDEREHEVWATYCDHASIAGGAVGLLGDTERAGLEGHCGHGDERSESGRLGAIEARPVTAAGAVGGLADATSEQRDAGGIGATRDESGSLVGPARHGATTGPAAVESDATAIGSDGRSGPTNGHWRAADWLLCRDGKWRPVEPGTFPLAHGAPARVGRLRGYGNAINLHVAQEFIAAYQEAKAELSAADVERAGAGERAA